MNPLLVTGSRGFVGRHVMAQARERGIVVTGFDGDLRDLDAMVAAVVRQAPRAVLHLASTPAARRRDDPWGALADDLRMAGNVVSALRWHAPGARLVLAGSAAQYGTGVDRLLREEDVATPLNAYGMAKALTEEACTSTALAGDLRVIAARAFNHCGPGQGLDAPAAQWARQLAEARRAGGGVLRTGDLTVRRDFTDVRDVADAYLELALGDHDLTGPVNVCSGEPMPLTRIVEILVAAAEVEVTVELDPTLVRPHDPRMVVGDPTRLRAATGWRPRVPLRDSLSDQFNEHLTSLETTA